MLEHFYGFWRGTEPTIDAWARAQPQAAARLDWDRRRRQDLLRSDLAAFHVAVDDLPVAPPALATADDAAVFGWLYVTEGSTLGGAVLDRRLRPLTTSLGVTLRSFTPYSEGPGPMWQAYHRVLDDWVADDSRRSSAVVAAAIDTFDALSAWLVPLRETAAA